MAQGAIALFEKNIEDALTIAKEYDKVKFSTSDQECQDADDYSSMLDLFPKEEELPF